jgi:hypothetical protein
MRAGNEASRTSHNFVGRVPSTDGDVAVDAQRLTAVAFAFRDCGHQYRVRRMDDNARN